MNVSLLDILAIITIFQLLIFSLFLFIKRNRNLSNILLGIHLTTQALGIFGGFANFNYYIFDNYTHLVYIGFPFTFLWGPTFYFYVKSFAFSDFRLKWDHILHAAPFLIVEIYLIVTFYFHDAESKKQLVWVVLTQQYSFQLFIFRFFQILIYCILSLVVLRTYKNRIKDKFSSISVLNQSWLQLVTIFFVANFAFTMLVYWIFYYLKIDAPVMEYLIFVLYIIFFNTIFFKGWSRHEVFEESEDKTKYKNSSLTKPDAEEWIKKINECMQTKKPYLIPGISVDQIAETLNIPSRILSQIINEYFSQNFYDYISSLRIEEAKRILSLPGNKKTILEVLYDTGYNSKAAFNKAFKKYTGLTPTQYKKESFMNIPITEKSD